MTRKKYINSNCPVYLSYAWANDENPFIERDVELVCELLENNNILYKRDKEDEENSLCDVEDEFDDYSAIIVVISERYIKSLYCMYEWHLIRKNDKIRDKIITVVCEDANISNENVFKKHLMWFTDRKDALQNKKKGNIIPLTEVESYAFEANFFIDDLIDLKDNYIPKAYNLRKDNYVSIISRIRLFIKRIDNNCGYTQTLVPHFSFPIPGHLIARENEENALFESLTRNRIVNLVGIGGSGKSSLAVLCLKKHGNNFNEIVYITVNKNIEEDFVEQTNKTLKLNFERNRFDETIAFLQENYKSEQPNLLVLDINETSDKDKNDATINLIIQNNVILEGWKFLILSRENIDTRNRIAAYNLNGKEDFDFLKKLFLDKAGARYNDFGDFVGLFNVIYYNPLLAEQLGWYLNYYPKTATLDDIKKILYGSLVEQKMQGISAAQRHGENVNTFLQNLIVYDKLAKNEQKLLSHFVLWQSEYIRYDVIADLLTGVFASEYELIETLTSLTKSSILATNNEETLSYKLHGLLANSLREQINIENGNYSDYLRNINRIIEYGYYKFIPFVDCVGNSLCEYDITNDFATLNSVALKFYNSWKDNYSEELFNKAIKICLDELTSDKDNPKCQNDLAWAYYNLACLQDNHLGDYDSAKTNYEKAIAIREQLPKGKFEYLNDLAGSYHRLAYLQIMHFGDYSSAEFNNQKAISICEQLPKDNPVYQNNLAGSYYNLALLQQKHLGDYDSAKANYEKAMAICEQLPKDNPEYQNDLASAYNNLANLQKEHLGDYDSAKSKYEKAIIIREQLPKYNLDYQKRLAGVYRNLAFLQQEHLEDYESAKSNYEKAIAILEKLPKDDPEYQKNLASRYFDLAYLQQKYLKDYPSAEENYKKAIETSESLPKENSFYQNNLAILYNNLADLQKNHIQDYVSAEENYKKAIEISENLPKDDPEYQNNLATMYDNLANLQSDQIEDYPSAEDNYKKAIEICENLPKDDSEYQNDLACIYNDLAILQSDHINDYSSAEDNYKKAIEISENLPKDNPFHLNNLAIWYRNLAYLQKKHLNDYASAEENYKKAIEIREKLPKGNPEYQNNLAIWYHNLANLQSDQTKDYASAEENYKKAIEIREKLPKNNPDYQSDLAGSYNQLAYNCDKRNKYDDAITAVNTAIDISFQLKETDSKYLIDWIAYQHSLSEIKYNNGKDIDEVKSILAEIQPLAQQCLKDNLDDSWTKEINDDINELLSKIEASGE